VITVLLDQFQFGQLVGKTIDIPVALGVLCRKMPNTPVATQRVVVEMVCQFEIGIAQKHEVARANIRVFKSPVDTVNHPERYCPMF
jgi:hypothetical protein